MFEENVIPMSPKDFVIIQFGFLESYLARLSTAVSVASVRSK